MDMDFLCVILDVVWNIIGINQTADSSKCSESTCFFGPKRSPHTTLSPHKPVNKKRIPKIHNLQPAMNEVMFFNHYKSNDI
jgi:hypothetical protein